MMEIVYAKVYLLDLKQYKIEKEPTTIHFLNSITKGDRKIIIKSIHNYLKLRGICTIAFE